MVTLVWSRVAGGWPTAVRAVVVVVDVLHADRGVPLVLADELTGVKQFVGHGPLVALDLAVVPWRVRLGALVACSGADEARKVG